MRGRALFMVAGGVVAVAVGLWLWAALRVGAAPAVVVDVERSAVGRETGVAARFEEPAGGLGVVRLELVQGERTELLAEQSFPRRGAFALLGGPVTPAAELTATIGTATQAWLTEGEVVLRATAERGAGSLRTVPPVVVEQRLPVRLRPPRLELMSSQHYVRQGGSGVVVFRVGDTAVRAGVSAGTVEATAAQLPGGGAGDRFALYAVPWNLSSADQIRLFAEDDAGNRAEQPFIDLFKPMPPRTDTIDVSDSFLAKVVPAIASQTPGFDASGSLLDQYLYINRELRRAELERVRELSRASEPAFLWSGAFLQMPNTQVRADFAQTRTYVYGGQAVDTQTHLGLDLASTERAPVPAPAAGRVLFAGWMTLYGNAVILDHGFGLLSLCGHLSSLAVAAGDQVERGDIIAASGATGLAGGDQLQLELLVHGQSVDPLEWHAAKWIRDNLGSKLPVPGV